MFGYYIEVSQGQADRMPDTFMRRQTLVNAERYITPELKDYENKVLTCRRADASYRKRTLPRAQAANRQHYAKCCHAHRPSASARMDCLTALAEAAKQNTIAALSSTTGLHLS